MNYNDFPILNNNEYEILNNHFFFQEKLSKNDLILNICNHLVTCINSCLDLEVKLNSKVLNSINDLKQTLIKIENNLTSYFNIKISPQKQISKFSIFIFLKNMLKINEIFIEWFSIEEKEYFKTMITNFVKEISKQTENVFLSLDNSFYHFYKHM